MGIDRRKLIQRTTAGALGSLMLSKLMFSRRASADAKPPLLLSIRIAGGWDPTMVFDSKVGVSSIDQEPGWQSSNISANLKIVTHADRPSVTSFFEDFGADSIILNGVNLQSIEHASAFDLNHSMSLSSSMRLRSSGRSDPLTTYAYAINPGLTVPNLNINSRATGGPLSALCHSISDEDINRYLSGNNSGSSQLNSKSNTALLKYVGSAYSRSLAGFPSLGLDSEKLDNLARIFSREQFLFANLGAIVAEIGNTVSSSFERNVKLALLMMAQGHTLSCSVGDHQFLGWDTHSNHFPQQSVKFENLFNVLSKTIQFAQSLELYQRLIILVSSDVGRNPTLNNNNGKDHWPYGSALIISPMLKGDQIVGVSDEFLRALPINAAGDIDQQSGKPVTMAQVYSSIYEICDLRPADYFAESTPLYSLTEET